LQERSRVDVFEAAAPANQRRRGTRCVPFVDRIEQIAPKAVCWPGGAFGSPLDFRKFHMPFVVFPMLIECGTMPPSVFSVRRMGTLPSAA
jgi:hypothetical protein